MLAPPAPNPCQVLFRDSGSRARPTLQDTQARSSFNNLKPVRSLLQQFAVDENWPSFPRSMDFPAQRNARVNSFSAHVHPVIGIFSKLLDATGVRRPSRQCKKLVKPQSLNIPTNLAEIEVAVIIQERFVVCVVVYPLLEYILGPPQCDRAWIRAEVGETADSLARFFREETEVRQVHMPILPS